MKEFRLDRKAAGAQALEGLWGPGPPGDLLYDVSAAGRGRGNHATRVGTGARSQMSDRGRVMLFNGADDAWNCERALATGFQSFTFCAWVWADSTTARTSAAILGIGDAAAGELMFRLQNSHLGNTGIRVYGDLGDIDTGAPVANFEAFEDSWAHVACTRQRHSAGLLGYINGVEVIADAAAGDSLNTPKVLQIGCADNDANRWWKGMIDDVRYYSRALSISEITHIYNATRWTPYADILLRPTRRMGKKNRAKMALK